MWIPNYTNSTTESPSQKEQKLRITKMTSPHPSGRVAQSLMGVTCLLFTQGPSPSYGSITTQRGWPTMCIPYTPCLLNASSNFTGGKQSWKFRWKTDWDLNVKQVPQLCHPNFPRRPRVISIQFSTFHQFTMVLHYLLTLLFIHSFQK